MNITARLIASCCIAATAALAGPALANEMPPEVSAASLLRGNEKGPNYTVLSPVQSDGLMRIFQVETPYGTYRVHGDAQLKTRIRELAAVRRLETMKASDTFVKSLGQAAAAPLKYGADLITDPKETLTRSVSGIANMFDRIGSGVRNQGASRDNVATSLWGSIPRAATLPSNSASTPIPTSRHCRSSSRRWRPRPVSAACRSRH